MRSELDYQGLIVKQLAAKSGVNIHTLNHYLSGKKVMPPADVAVKIASALGVSVEYLVTGADLHVPMDKSVYREYRRVIDNLEVLSEDVRTPILAMIETAANRALEKKEQSFG
ncbi:MAG: helix-turn-helix transcriptional regulator [Spirochaetaceae bacterium]|nr:helix-turn-helix transcriptional regulator [Spirochaetaceae bacterium]